MPDSPADVTAAIEELIEAYRALRHRILINEGILTEALEQISGGAGVGQTLMTIPSLRERRAAEEAVLSLYDTRHKLRSVVIRTAVAEGLGVGDLAKAYGIGLDTVIGHASETHRTLTIDVTTLTTGPGRTSCKVATHRTSGRPSVSAERDVFGD